MVKEKQTTLQKGQYLFTHLMKAPGVKVDRKTFLRSVYRNHENIEKILINGPVGLLPADEIKKTAMQIIQQTTMKSSAVSFAAGLPGGLAAVLTIPADVVQFYGMALVLAQKLMYLYGYPDLYFDSELQVEGRNMLLIFLGAMLGVEGAHVTIKNMVKKLTEKAASELPQKELPKIMYQPIVKKVLHLLGMKATRESLVKSVSKAIPLVGGVVSGGLTYLTLRPMGLRLQKTLHQARYGKENF